MDSGVYGWIRNRQTETDRSTNIVTTFKGSHYLTQRLANSAILTGHNGCVNTVSWSRDGTYLLSGSDDCHLNVYNSVKRQLLFSKHSSHRSNIFSAKFLPFTCDFKCVSCAGLGSVEFSEFTTSGDYLPHIFNCQTSITYQVATTPFDPNEFFTCEERGLVRLYDLRAKSSCSCEGCQKDVLYSFPCGVTSLSVHPLYPNYVALALGDGTTCLMDRRVTGPSPTVGSLTPTQLASRACYVRYKPDNMKVKPFKITCVQFNETGSELLVSYSEDYLYLFNSVLLGCSASQGQAQTRPSLATGMTYKERSKARRKNIEQKHKTGEQGGDNSNKFTPPMKRLRLRGDWSDTGPEARPEGDREMNNSTFMNRMSHFFSRLINEPSTSPEEENESEDSPSPTNSFQLFSDSEEDSNPRTPTSSLTSAMALCSTQSQSNVNEQRENEQSLEDSETIGNSQPVPIFSEHNTDHQIQQRNDLLLFCEDSQSTTVNEVPPTDGLETQNSNNSTVLFKVTSYSSSTDSHLVEQNTKLTDHQTLSDDVPTMATVDTDMATGSSSCINDTQTIPIGLADHIVPVIQIVEGESDSDDIESIGGDEFEDETAEQLQTQYNDMFISNPVMIYQGHRNARTMIKQANFWGNNFILCGSDCGRVFIWDKWTGEVVNVLVGDSHVVNCVQPHPYACVLATSGIDYDIKLWEPIAKEACNLHDLKNIMERNDLMLQESRNTITVPSSFILHVLSYLNRRRRMRSEEGADESPPVDEDSS